MAVQAHPSELMFCKLLVHNKLAEDSALKKVLSQKKTWSQPTFPEECVSQRLISAAHAEKVKGAVEAKGLSFPIGFDDDAELSSPSPEPAPVVAAPAAQAPVNLNISSPIPHDSDLIPTLPSSPAGPGKKVIEMLVYAREHKASDLHITVHRPAMMRQRGELVELKTSSFSPEQTEAMLFDILLPDQKERLRKDLQLDFSLILSDGSRCRSNIVKDRVGWVACFRLVPDHLPCFKELGLPEVMQTLTEYPTGLVLVTGPMGSGKTTTLAAMLDLINQNRKDHIITVEDPIEFKHPSKGCQVTQRSLGSETKSFSNALKGALRQDPDVIMIGELRDLETISIAITAAETGHLVLGSLHTNSAERTIDRLVSSFPPDQQAQIRVMIADSIRGIVSQQLLPSANGEGVELALEILLNNTSVRNMIVDNRTFQLQSVMQTGKKQGMIQMDESIKNLLEQGKITKEVALAHMRNPGALK